MATARLHEAEPLPRGKSLKEVLEALEVFGAHIGDASALHECDKPEWRFRTVAAFFRLVQDLGYDREFTAAVAHLWVDEWEKLTRKPHVMPKAMKAALVVALGDCKGWDRRKASEAIAVRLGDDAKTLYDLARNCHRANKGSGALENDFEHALAAVARIPPVELLEMAEALAITKAV